YNLMDNLAKTATYYKSMKADTTPYFQFGPANTQLTGQKAKSIAVTFSSFRTTDFTYTKGHYVNTNAYSGNKPFLADNVIVVRVKEGNAGYLDPAGNPVPESILTGKGQMVLFHNGVAVKGTWSKGSQSSIFLFKTVGGAVLKIPAGRTYLELAPVSSAGGGLSYH
ncbi:MAG: DUF3048 C-terminal domain-containing protein, partial [Marmoricola sp.]